LYLAALFAAFDGHADSTNAAPPAPTNPPGAEAPVATPTSQSDFVEQPVGDYALPTSAATQPGVSAQPSDLSAAPTWSSAGSPVSPFGFLSGIGHSSNMLGDMWGLRPALARYGTTLSVQDQSEVLGNLTGGSRQGFAYDGLITATLQMDTQRAFGWYGGLFNVAANSWSQPERSESPDAADGERHRGRLHPR
jgi:hypothetical protein